MTDDSRARAAQRRAGEMRAKTSAARLKVAIDKKRGMTTPAWIRELAEQAPPRF